MNDQQLPVSVLVELDLLYDSTFDAQHRPAYP